MCIWASAALINPFRELFVSKYKPTVHCQASNKKADISSQLEPGDIVEDEAAED